jgi:hypothetical protein
MSTVVELEIFSPRWGHEDTYTVNLTQDFMEISMGVRKCKATYDDCTDPIWTGELIDKIMGNDSIYPPVITQDLFEYAWKSWRNGDLNDQEVTKELTMVAVWINTVTKAKPQSNFWQGYF